MSNPPPTKANCWNGEENEEKVRQAKALRILGQNVKMSQLKREMNSAVAQI